jgi:crotonobetainyl-CoA:carnitine CoA-transferase CaiB-like acyl-CoA transferase
MERFLPVLGVQNVIGKDDRFKTNADRIKHRAILVPQLQNIFSRQTAGVWIEKFAATEIPAAPTNTVAEAVSAAQTRARGLIVQLEHPVIGTAKSIANPIHFSATPVSYRLPPPRLGEHTAEILRTLGYSKNDARATEEKSAT